MLNYENARFHSYNGRFEDFLLFFRTSKKSREKTKDTQFLTPFFLTFITNIITTTTTTHGLIVTFITNYNNYNIF